MEWAIPVTDTHLDNDISIRDVPGFVLRRDGAFLGQSRLHGCSVVERLSVGRNERIQDHRELVRGVGFPVSRRWQTLGEREHFGCWM